ncbi:hypothetical protein EMPG_12806 [Blastomyces silverae]|uniref:Uncharacterized protein n=1 Tax=Blastomyces silverae TaxID=2060906 RepID=A0A0H1BKJ4_9EURO|nr:hypothetical protein EMPG_12806 [Blastomyces silverae]
MMTIKLHTLREEWTRFHPVLPVLELSLHVSFLLNQTVTGTHKVVPPTDLARLGHRFSDEALFVALGSQGPALKLELLGHHGPCES